MQKSNFPTLVVGASGPCAGLVVSALARRGAAVRGMIRDGSKADQVREHGATEVVVADLMKPDSLRHALEGIERAFYIAPAFLPGEAEVGQRFVAAAVDAGVRRIVFSSVIHPVIASLVNHAGKAPVEEAILDSGIEYTFLHPALFFQNYAHSWAKIVKSGVLAEPWSCETRFSRVDYRDVAEVAAMALIEDGLLYGTFELAAEGWLDRYDVAALIGEVLQRDIRAERVDPAKLGDALAPMRPMFDHYDRVGLRTNALSLRAITGREPRSLKDFFSGLAASSAP